jgi:soluble lytic murein transglycosylase
MTILPCSVTPIQVRWFRASLVALVTLILFGGATHASPAKNKKKSARRPASSKQPASSKKTATKRPVAAEQKKSRPPVTPATPQLAALAAGMRSSEQENYSEVLRALVPIQGKLPKLDDYVSFHLAKAQFEQKDYASARKNAASVIGFSPLSPFRAQALILEARSSIAQGSAADAIRDLRAQYADLRQPDGDFALAEGYRQLGDLPQAAVYFQRVYYLYPASDRAAEAESAISALRESLGSSYPPATASDRVGRAGTLLASRRYPAARAEYLALLNQLSGPERDLAEVGVGAADYLDGKATQACRYLQGLEPRSDEAGAQRLYYLFSCARSRSDTETMERHLKSLEKSYPKSLWRLKALVAAGNRLLLYNDTENYVPIYRDCAKDFPETPDAAYCHWKVAWHSYLNRKRDADDLMREHLEGFPQSVKASSALYFLGRLAEKSDDFGKARVYYERLDQRYRGYYYAQLARERLAQPKVAGAAADKKTLEYVDRLRLPAARTPLSFTASRETAARTERARLLHQSGLDDLAAFELRFGARNGTQPHLLAMELARLADEPPEALRHMKALVRDYFAMAPEDAPEQFWQYLFPLPYRDSLVTESERNALDPHMVAGLIRQESEFNPRAVSRARAYGLTQILPSTGRQLARRAGVRGFRTTLLFQPAINLKLGTIYLRNLLDQWGGRWEETLASYNAGKSRVDEWLTWGQFEEPAEFVETIPFTETRDYVQAVIRNANVYRRLYGEDGLNRTAATRQSAKP